MHLPRAVKGIDSDHMGRLFLDDQKYEDIDAISDSLQAGHVEALLHVIPEFVYRAREVRVSSTVTSRRLQIDYD